MEGALVILAAMIVVGVLLFITDKKYYRHHHHASESTQEHENSKGAEDDHVEEDSLCCGQHLICEKTFLSIVSDEIIYYDDEELDRFSGRLPESYNAEETEEFRDVLMTLLPQDIAGWARSITLRRIELPSEVKDELLLLINDLRTT